MTTTENILNYAAAHGGTFLRKELLQEIAGEQTSIKVRAVDLQISRYPTRLTVAAAGGCALKK